MNDRLYRSRDERVLFGVCGGIAERLDVDPSLVRIVFALLVISAGVGIALYVIMAFVVPEEPEDMPAGTAAMDDDRVVAADSAASDPTGGAGTSAASGDATGAATSGPAAAAAGLSAGPTIGGTAASRSSEPMTRRETRRANKSARQSRGPGRGGMVMGAVLIIVGLWFLAGRYLPVIAEDFFGPVVLIGLGLLLLVGALGKRGDGGAPRPR